jgi:hypothetical protein
MRHIYKSAAQILADHGFAPLMERPAPPPLPFSTDINGPITDALRDSPLARAAMRTASKGAT